MIDWVTTPTLEATERNERYGVPRIVRNRPRRPVAYRPIDEGPVAPSKADKATGLRPVPETKPAAPKRDPYSMEGVPMRFADRVLLSRIFPTPRGPRVLVQCRCGRVDSIEAATWKNPRRAGKRCRPCTKARQRGAASAAMVLLVVMLPRVGVAQEISVVPSVPPSRPVWVARAEDDAAPQRPEAPPVGSGPWSRRGRADVEHGPHGVVPARGGPGEFREEPSKIDPGPRGSFSRATMAQEGQDDERDERGGAEAEAQAADGGREAVGDQGPDAGVGAGSPHDGEPGVPRGQAGQRRVVSDVERADHGAGERAAREGRREDRARLRMIVGEVGTLADDDHTAMLHGFEELRGGRDLEGMLSRHIPWWDAGHPPGRPWVAELELGCERPPSYPRRLRWAGARQHGCFRAVAKVRALRNGTLPRVCKGRPNQWRSRKAPKLQRAARRKGWKRIGCGPNTLHVYWRAT